VDDEKREIVIQGYQVTSDMLAEISGIEWVPGHTVGIPEGEVVIRIPARMAPILRKACDDADRPA
jgi:hypothetical protein